MAGNPTARDDNSRAVPARAVDDPATLARAARIVRAALARTRGRQAECTPRDPVTDTAGNRHPGPAHQAS